MQKLNTQKGITLIALVITIIVMMILVGVSVTVALNGGLFSTAQKAVGDTEAEKAKEQTLASGRVKVNGIWYDSLEAYERGERSANQGNTENEEQTPQNPDNPEIPDGGEQGESVETVPNPEETFSQIYLENETITEGNYTAVIPKGFAVGTSNGINTIAGGLVITDKVNSQGQSIGNEFVWIPVTYEVTGEKDENGLYPGFLDAFKRNGRTSDYMEPYTSGYMTPTTEVDDYYDMMLSVQNNYGFYVGRYEAGIEPTCVEDGETKTNLPRTSGENNGTSKVVVKRDCYPYMHVGWGESMSNYTNQMRNGGYDQGFGVLYLSKHLLDGQETGTKSTLMYGVQWDAMLRFMEKLNERDSKGWGNYKDSSILIDRETAKYTTESEGYYSTWIDASWYSKSKGKMAIFTTGAHDEFEEKNIYDVAGNVMEWTMESLDAEDDYRTLRGGSFSSGESVAEIVYGIPREHYLNKGFRPVLYISNN